MKLTVIPVLDDDRIHKGWIALKCPIWGSPQECGYYEVGIGKCQVCFTAQHAICLAALEVKEQEKE